MCNIGVVCLMVVMYKGSLNCKRLLIPWPNRFQMQGYCVISDLRYKVGTWWTLTVICNNMLNGGKVNPPYRIFEIGRIWP